MDGWMDGWMDGCEGAAKTRGLRTEKPNSQNMEKGSPRQHRTTYDIRHGQKRAAVPSRRTTSSEL